MNRTLLILSFLLLNACQAFSPANVGHEGQPCSTKNTCRGDLLCVSGRCIDLLSSDGDDADRDDSADSSDIETPLQDGDREPEAEFDSELSDSERENDVPLVLTWEDGATGYTWQVTPPTTAMSWQNAVAYCNTLMLGGHENWQLPKISELRSLVKGCQSTMSSGLCAVADDCLSDSCATSCSGCTTNVGPADGCYWPEALAGSCKTAFWSVSSPTNAGSTEDSWYVHFGNALIAHIGMSHLASVRCLRKMIVQPDDGDVEVDAESEEENEATSFSCVGGICTDSITGFEWQQLQKSGSYNGTVWNDAVAYCQALDLGGAGWYLPNLSELRSLIRNCSSIQTGGLCAVTDVCERCGVETACLSTSSCHSSVECDPSSCGDNGGPTGCYWPQELGGLCGIYWSSSSYPDVTIKDAWDVDFYNGSLGTARKIDMISVRCMRDPNAPPIDGDIEAENEVEVEDNVSSLTRMANPTQLRKIGR